MATLPPRLNSRPKHAKRGGSHHDRPKGSAWQKQRARIIEAQPLCAYCFALDAITASTVADHIIALSLGGSSDDSNLIGSCERCNKAKALKEQEWARAGHSLKQLDHAPPVRGSLKWFVTIARQTKYDHE